MKTASISKEEILAKSRELLCSSGYKQLNIRNLAQACGVSIGTIYNHLGSKDELLELTVESIWFEIFHAQPLGTKTLGIKDYLIMLYQQLEAGAKRYPNFFKLHMTSLKETQEQDAKASQAQEKMQATWMHIRKSFERIILHDPQVSKEIFDQNFSAEDCSRILFSLLLSSLIQEDYSPRLSLCLVDELLHARQA